jgi:DNA-directed RNA polymerase specialized sigma24 family protein
MKSTALSRDLPSPDMEAMNRLISALQDQAFTLAYYVLSDEDKAEMAAQEGIQQVWREFRRKRAPRVSKFEPSGRAQILAAVLRVCARTKTRRDGAPRQGTFSSAEGLYAGLVSLAFEERAVLVLVDVLKLDYAEAAAVIGRRAQAVRKSLAQARQHLCEAIRTHTE